MSKKRKKRKKEHKEHKGGGEIPDVSDMRVIKLISQHVYTQRTAVVYYLIVCGGRVTLMKTLFQHPSNRQCPLYSFKKKKKIPTELTRTVCNFQTACDTAVSQTMCDKLNGRIRHSQT